MAPAPPTVCDVRRLLSRKTLTWLGYLAAFAALYVLTRLLGLDANTLAAAAGAIAAVAAWRAAAESGSTARDARDALGHAIRPRLAIELFQTTTRPDGTSQIATWIKNQAPFPAADITVRTRACDGTSDVVRFERLDAARAHLGPKERGPHHMIWVPLPADHDKLTGIDEIVVQYSDERGLLRWELSYRRTHSYRTDGGIATRTTQDQFDERRVR